MDPQYEHEQPQDRKPRDRPTTWDVIRDVLSLLIALAAIVVPLVSR
ncbi:hypothetical protein [Streptomyces sp. NPDC090026]